ncbi:MAG: T9SS type A sorting domain-containing protein [Ignavibacteria bacterium]|nr:T9SS type A sorting domain-containing protein [Ignavibacteria bacterium]
MKNSIFSKLLYKCKNFVEAFVLFFMLSICAHAQTSPDYIFGDNNGSTWSWGIGTQGTSGLGNSYKWVFQATATINQYFKFGETSSNTDGQGFWMNNASPDLQYTGAGAVWNSYYYGNLGSNGALYFPITNAKYYVLKAKKDGSNSNANFSIQELSAAPVTIAGVSDNYQTAGSSMNVYITLSGSKSAEERVFVKYTTDNWSTSSISSEATGSGTSYTAIIPGSGVTATANNKYYIFTTTVATPSASEADLLAINYNNNAGNYYQVFSKFLTVAVNGWQTTLGRSGPVMWSNLWLTPTTKSCVGYPCGHPTWATITAYLRVEFNTIGGSNGNNCDCSPYTGSGIITTTSASEEQTNVVNGTTGITFYLGAGNMSGFMSHCTTGDTRIYAGSDGYIKVDGVNKLVFDSYRTVMEVVYATNSITSTGWAKINVVASDPLWVKEFDPYNTGQVLFDAVSSSPVVQECYGSYNVSLKIKPAPSVSVQSTGTVSTQGSITETVSLPNSDVEYYFTFASFGGESGNGVYANEIMTAPVGSLPSGIDAISQLYWDLSTVLDTFTCSLTFDLSDVTGISNTANLRILKRVDSNSPWSIWSDHTLVDATHLRANNVTSLSEWAIGSTGGNALPVELETFMVSLEKTYIALKWTTATELNSYGFEVERRLTECGCEWEKIGFIPASGNSNSPKNYELKDFVKENGNYVYRLKMIDTDGKFDYSKEVQIKITAPLKFDLSQNYPNPFNPVTTIKFALPEASKVSLKIFSIMGEEVVELVNEEKSAGYHQFEFDASGLSSGIYFYKIVANNFSHTKKMLVVK